MAYASSNPQPTRTYSSAKRTFAASLLLLISGLGPLSVSANSADPDVTSPKPADSDLTDPAVTKSNLTNADLTSTVITELLMVEEAGCAYCAKFDHEISEAYPKTTEGKAAPLRRLDLHKDWPASLSHINRPKYTPTFILVHDNQEVGRLIGYNGDEYFWFLLGELMQNIDLEVESSESAAGTETGS